jgi:ligand-binding sensor domain-containing protein/signal transduction histidine kinase
LRSLNIFREDGFGRRWLFRCAIAGLASLCFAVTASAVDPTRTVSQYLHDSWGTERGWPGGSITAIAQTSDGYLWIGTDKGLVRFDGLNFQLFERAHPDPILFGPIRTLLVDAGDNLWILLQNTQLLRYHNGDFELIRGEAENGTTAIARGTSGAVLLSSLALGTLTYSDNRFRTLSSAALPADAARIANGEAPDQRSTPFSWNYGMMPDRQPALTSLVIALAQTDDGKIWLGTERRGLFYLEQGRILSALNERVDTKINCLLPLQNSELWVGTAKGVTRWNGTELTWSGIPSSLVNLDVLSVLRDRDSNIWVGTSRGLFRYNANGVSLLSTHEITGPVTALFEDREGNIWIGSPRGLERLRDSAFVTYSIPNLKSQNMGPLYVDSGGRTWIAPIQGGLRWLKEGKSGVVTADRIAHDIVYSITGTVKDDVWVGRQQGGLTHLRYSGNSFTAKTYTQADGLAQNSVYAVYRSRNGTVWAGTLNSGVSELKNGHFKNYATTDGLAANTISSIAEGRDGTMWFGTPNGLSALTKDGWRTYTMSEGLASQDVNCLLQGSNDVLWIGTAEGLAFFSAGHLKVPQLVPDSLHEAVLGLAEDRNGGLWVVTADHVLQVKRTGLMGSALSETDVREYGLADGLSSTEGVKRSQSVVADSQGRVWFSTNRGLSMVNPARGTANLVPVLVHIEAVLVDGSPLDPHGPIRLPAGTHRTTFRYVGLSLGNADRVRYRYMLEGLDHEWSQAVTNREATYGSLGPGTYRFRVMASNSEGAWNDPGATLSFFVTPAWYQTNSFRLACFLAGILLLWALYRLRIRQVAHTLAVRFDERLAERTRIAREFHDTLIQTIQGSKLVADDALDQSADPARMRHALERLSEWLDRAIQEGRAALNSLRTSATETNDLAEGLRRATEECRMFSSMETSFSVEGGPKEMHPVVRDEIYRIGYEAIRNACVHSKASRLQVDLKYGQDLAISVGDNGVGIPESIIDGGTDGHYGLQGMRERASRIGGKLRIVSSVDSGTEVSLVIPGRIAFHGTGSNGIE